MPGPRIGSGVCSWVDLRLEWIRFLGSIMGSGALQQPRREHERDAVADEAEEEGQGPSHGHVLEEEFQGGDDQQGIDQPAQFQDRGPPAAPG